MTPEAVIAAAREVTFSYPLKAWGLRVEAWPSPFDAGRVFVRLCGEAPDATQVDGRLLPLVISDDVASSAFSGPEQVWAKVRSLALALAAHEVDESLQVQGQRRWDPHACVRNSSAGIF